MTARTSWNPSTPTDWLIRPLKHWLTNVTDIVSPAPDGSDYIALDQIEGWTGRRLVPEIPPKPESSVKRFSPGDVLFCKLRPYLAKAFLPASAGVFTGEMLVLRPGSAVSARYLWYLLRAKPFIDRVALLKPL